MSSADVEADEVCASCGKVAVDDVKLKICTACRLVKYCSVECQKNHRPQHKKACKKRLAEIRDDRLFTQPDESHLGECPICCLPLPLPLDESKFVLFSCCCKRLCLGCDYANYLREEEQGLEHRCPYCREPIPETQEEADKVNYMDRVEARDPIALFQLGVKCNDEGDYEGAVEYYTMAAKLGNMNAHYNLGSFYEKGKGVKRDLKKKIYHLEEAAIGGHPDARFNLGNHERRNGNIQRAVKHYIIAANLGDDDALEAVKTCFAHGFVSKEDFEAALSGYQTAVDAMKSVQREEAYAFYNV